ncbi:hypothetical protein NW117_02290 [Staphylococcus pettenkoferi]|nr:hypothetical protein [Staphylococcus pettenkoferi]MCY1619589.1 hypothetical protein [Staphylococcus pettenkoferi]
MSLDRYSKVVTDKSDETKSADRINKAIDEVNKHLDKDSKIAHVKDSVNSHLYTAIGAEDEMFEYQDEYKEKLKQAEAQGK